MMDVFIVEDEEMIQQLYRDVLSMRGYNVVEVAETGEEAVDKFREFKQKPDLVIMDHRMPGMGGLDAARMIMEEDPSTKIILVSADDNAVWEALKIGIVGMKKPFNIGDLLSAIEASTPKDSPKKKEKSQVPEAPIKHSGLYLVEELDAERSVDIFKALLANDYKGMAFSRKHPDFLKGLVGEDDLPVVWFTSTPVKEYTCISPINIQKMLIMVQSAISNNEKSAILIWGFEYILTNINFDRALNLLQVLNDRVMTTRDCILLFSMDLEILGERERKLVAREFEILK
jgi:YesN/AraC family two-component response regulator